MPDLKELCQRLKNERDMIKQFPIHFCSVCIIVTVIITVSLYSVFDLALHLKSNTIEAYKERFGDLTSEKPMITPSPSNFFDGIFEIPSGQPYADVVVSLGFKPKGAMGTVMDSSFSVFASVDGATLTNVSTSGIRFNFSGIPSKGSRLAVHIF
jgi:hypothetical protein